MPHVRCGDSCEKVGSGVVSAFPEWDVAGFLMVIHIITHENRTPFEAYLDRDTAVRRYLALKAEQDGYGIVTLEIKDAEKH